MPNLESNVITSLKIDAAVYLDETGAPVQGYVVSFAYADGTGSERIATKSNDPESVRRLVEEAVARHQTTLKALGLAS